MFTVENKDNLKTSVEIVMVPLVLTLNKFNILI